MAKQSVRAAFLKKMQHRECVSKKLGVRQRKELARMRQIAVSRGGKLASRFYANESTNLEWLCGKGHRWKTSAYNIKRGSWCPTCGRKNAAANRRTHTIEEMRRLAAAKGGVCLSNNYQSAVKKLRWRCKLGHEWETMPVLVIKGYWCPKCARHIVGQKLKATIQDFQKIAAERGGICLSKTYTDGRQKLLWSCSKGHLWRTSANCVRNGNWCSVCAREQRAEARRAHTINEMQQLAKAKGGVCLSKVFQSCAKKLRWRCKFSHEWETIPRVIINGSWCPVCGRKHQKKISEGFNCE
jgi:glutaredoxin-related protein